METLQSLRRYILFKLYAEQQNILVSVTFTTGCPPLLVNSIFKPLINTGQVTLPYSLGQESWLLLREISIVRFIGSWDIIVNKLLNLEFYWQINLASRWRHFVFRYIGWISQSASVKNLTTVSWLRSRFTYRIKSMQQILIPIEINHDYSAVIAWNLAGL